MKWSKVLKSKSLLCIVALSIYIFLGSIIFVHIERPDESNEVVANRMFNTTKEKLSRQFGVNITEDEFFALVSQIEGALSVQARSEWTYRNTIDWLTISLTTIGYGDVVPRTPLGQGVFIIYALIGLPLTMITLKNTGEFLSRCIFRFIQVIEKKVFGKDEPTKLKLKTLIVSLLAFMILHLYTASVFVHFENVTFLEGTYASFITLSTIGFGDYQMRLKFHRKKVPYTVGHGILQVLFLPYMIFNLSIVSCFLNSLMSMMESVHRISNENNEVTTRDEYHGSTQ